MTRREFILALLREWDKCPEMRFGQFLENLGQKIKKRGPSGKDFFYVFEEVILGAAREFTYKLEMGEFYTPAREVSEEFRQRVKRIVEKMPKRNK